MRQTGPCRASSRALLIHQEQSSLQWHENLGPDWNQEDGDQDEVNLVLGGDHSDSDLGDRGQTSLWTSSHSSSSVQILLPRQEIETFK